MQQSEKLDLGAGFLSVDLDAAGAFGAASDLRWRNALVLIYATCQAAIIGTQKKKKEKTSLT
jgi:hypothetical protein